MPTRSKRVGGTLQEMTLCVLDAGTRAPLRDRLPVDVRQEVLATPGWLLQSAAPLITANFTPSGCTHSVELLAT